MKTSEVVGLLFGGIGASLAVVSFVKAQSCQPPSGGCPPGETFDYKACKCVPSSGGTYDVSFLVEGPSGPIAGAVGLLGSTPAYSDSGGNMAFSGVAAGTYLFTCSASGYVDVNEQVGISAAQTSFTVDMKLCAPPPGGCQCGSVFSGSACTCVAQQPAIIDIDGSVPFDANWAVTTTNGIGYVALATCPGGCSPPTGLNATTLAYDVGGKVVDANGAPVCGVPVTASLGALESSQWQIQTGGGTWTGYFRYGIKNPTARTDASGAFSFEVDITIVASFNGAGCFPCSCEKPLNQTFPIALYTTVSSSVKAVTTLAMSSLICGYSSAF